MLLDIANDPPSARTYGWKQRLPETPLAHRAFESGYARLQTLVDACPEARHLVHSDLLNFNVLVTDDRISAVLDWGSSIYGDFLWDLAWFTFWQPWYTAWASVDLRKAALASLPTDRPGGAKLRGAPALLRAGDRPRRAGVPGVGRQVAGKPGLDGAPRRRPPR